MSVLQALTPAEVREYVSDFSPNNYLIEGEEFTETYIVLCMELAVAAFNGRPPLTQHTISTFPNKSTLLQGTLWQMYQGKAALLARNTMSYSDGGLQIPIEERSQLYLGLAAAAKSAWDEQVTQMKVFQNMADGWGDLRGDQSYFPLW